MTMPNFLVIGAAKSGTTAFNVYLQQHPQIYMSPVKEPRFFSYADMEVDPNHPVLTNDTITDLAEYEALYDGVTDELAYGEASPSYLHNTRAPGNIMKYAPDAKLVAILRQPAERAFSHFLHFIKNGYEQEFDFAKALDDLEFESNGWKYRQDYITFGYYGEQLRRYYDVFDREQIKVYLFDDFRSDPAAVMKDLFFFLGVNQDFEPDMSHKPNVSGVPKNAWLHNFLSNMKLVKVLGAPVKLLLPKGKRRLLLEKMKNRNLEKPELDAASRKRLTDLYRSDILDLQELIGRDLSVWLAD